MKEGNTPVESGASIDVDFRFSEVVKDPYAELARIRPLGDAIWNSQVQRLMLWRYQDVRRILSNDRSFSNQETALKEAFGPEGMLFVNFADHNRARGVWAKTFSAKESADRFSWLRAISEETLAPMIARLEAGETVDIVPAFQEITVTAITHLMDVPKDRRDDFRRWNNVLANAAQLAIPVDDPRYLHRESVKREVYEFLEEQVADRTARIADGGEPDDLVSMMVSASHGGDITSRAAVDNLLNLFLAALDTTARFMGNMLVQLLLHPEVLDEIRRDRDLLPNAIEEVFRLHPANQVISRRVEADDVVVGGRAVPKGEEIFLLTGAANRDPAMFEDPERFDIRRPNASAHLAFGWGVHQCIGLHLARTEIHAFFHHLLDVLPKVEIVSIDYGDNWTLWGPHELMLQRVP